MKSSQALGVELHDYKQMSETNKFKHIGAPEACG